MSGQRTQWNEATRVQMPALVHLTRIGFTYFGKITEDKAGTVYDPDTNILIEVFKSQFAKLNPERAGEAEAMLRIIRQELDNDDIGESFYKRLKAVSPVRLIDFEHPENNTFHCSAEFTCKRDEDEFRPDITLFVNGLPLVFIEVKKPNNIGGMVAEAERMNKLRFPNKKFRRFINITQLMIFSNNMEYDAMGGIVPIQGVFYCTGSKKGSPFNCFREENPLNLDVAPYNRDFPYKDIDPEVEKQILSDFNNQVIHTSPEYQTNLQTTTPTNRVLTSMCSPDRLLFLLKYGITYYHKTKELDDGTIEQIDQKHIMRYQQFFAAMIVRERMISDLITQQDDIKVIEIKDYIKNPKSNGYRSYHMIVEIPVFFAKGKTPMRVELQIRTNGMDFWATLEHQLRYKKGIEEMPGYDEISEELLHSAKAIIEADNEMQRIKDKIGMFHEI